MEAKILCTGYGPHSRFLVNGSEYYIYEGALNPSGSRPLWEMEGIWTIRGIYGQVQFLRSRASRQYQETSLERM